MKTVACLRPDARSLPVAQLAEIGIKRVSSALLNLCAIAGSQRNFRERITWLAIREAVKSSGARAVSRYA